MEDLFDLEQLWPYSKLINNMGQEVEGSSENFCYLKMSLEDGPAFFSFML